MKLSIGIVGLPNVGKSTLFKLITSQEVHIANYPFATIDPNVGVVPVPDERVDALAKLSSSKKRVPAVVEFYDIAGLVKGASKGEGLGNQFLSHIRDVSAVCFVLRCFPQADIVHVEGSVDPVRDYEILKTELALKDLETVDKRISKAEADVRNKTKEGTADLAALQACKAVLDRGEFLMDANGALPPGIDLHARIMRELNLLTAKPRLYLLNGDTGDVPDELLRQIGVIGTVNGAFSSAPGVPEVLSGRPGSPAVAVRDLPSKMPRSPSAIGTGVVIANLATAPNVNELITAAYATLGLVSFFTTGEDETRAWTIEHGAKAPQAAGVIHTDFEEKFIRAEVVAYADLIATGGWSHAKQRGKMRLEGKDYVVQDGDVMVIRHG
ncbi:MAG: redox-regulated ATPase YchF [bacterium]|nr:redox-regulated ATPase YchF [bacterium]